MVCSWDSNFFLGSDNRQITFDPEDGYAISSLSIYNLRLISKNSIVRIFF